MCRLKWLHLEAAATTTTARSRSRSRNNRCISRSTLSEREGAAVTILVELMTLYLPCKCLGKGKVISAGGAWVILTHTEQGVSSGVSHAAICCASYLYKHTRSDAPIRQSYRKVRSLYIPAKRSKCICIRMKIKMKLLKFIGNHLKYDCPIWSISWYDINRHQRVIIGFNNEAKAVGEAGK